MHTILIADDSVTIQRAVEIVFDKEPFTVVKAGSAGEALQRARDAQPHLVLVDHTFVDRSGYDLADALRADPATAQIPVLIFSTTAMPFDEGRGRAAGVLGHLPKPFDCTTLLDRVKSILGVTASGPVAGAVSVAPTPAAVAATPRPPSVPGSIPGMARPPAGPPPGLPRPPSFGSTAGVGAAPAAAAPAAAPSYAQPSYAQPSYAQPSHAQSSYAQPSYAQPVTSAGPQTAFGVPASAPRPPISSPPANNPFGGSPAPVSQPPARTQTPMPNRDVDPFGFGSSLSQPPTPAVAPGANPFATSAPPRAAESDFEVSIDDISPQPASTASPSGVAPGADAASSLSDAEFMEVSDADLAVVSTPPAAAVASIAAVATITTFSSGAPAQTPSEEKTTVKLDGERIAALAREEDEAAAARARAVTSIPTPAPVSVASTAAAVVERAAPALAAAGAAPSAEALSAEARTIVERIAWEVVPELAEAIIREEIRRLLQAK